MALDTLENLLLKELKSKDSINITGYIDAGNMKENGDLRFTINLPDSIIDCDIQGNNIIVAQVTSRQPSCSSE